MQAVGLALLPHLLDLGVNIPKSPPSFVIETNGVPSV
jgi:hypothetical protein